MTAFDRHPFKMRSHRAKVRTRAEIVFHVFRLFFHLLVVFDLFRFRLV